MLRRAAIGAIMVRTDPLTGDVWYAYEDGTDLRNERRHPVSTRAICRFIREGWLLPGDQPGTWRARTLADPAIPKPETDMAQQKPTPQQTAILRRISTHKLIVAFVDGKKTYSYGDGLPVKRGDAERIVHNRWVVPESPGLFRDHQEPQSYVCRQP